MLPEAFLPREEGLDGRSGGLDQLTPNSRGVVGSAPSIDNRISQKSKERRVSFILPRIRSKMCTELSKGAVATRAVLLLWQEIGVEGTGWREDRPLQPWSGERLLDDKALHLLTYVSGIPGVNHNVALPPTRDPRPHRRLSTRRTEGAQSLLRCFQILDPADANIPLRSRRILCPEIPHRAVEEGVPGPFHLSRSLYAHSLHSWYSAHHHHRWGCG
jgi:hypothetical protein